MQDTVIATLLRRASARHPHGLRPHALVRPAASSTSATGTLATFSCQQQFLQDVHDADEARAPSHTAEATVSDVGHNVAVFDGASDVDRLVSELYEFRDTLGDTPSDCLSSSERRFASLLHDRIVASVAKTIFAASAEPHGATSTKEACRALLTLCVKPTAAARELAFELMHNVLLHTAVRSTRTPNHQLFNDLFVCVNDMVTKVVAVASSAVASMDGWSSDGAWLVNATACLVVLIRHVGGDDYRVDRLVRLDASSILFFVRRAFGLGANAELQETVVEIIVCAMYAHRNRAAGGGLSLADVDRFGGIDSLLAIYYTTMSERSRRLLLLVMFDLAVDQLKRSRDDKDAWPTHESLLRCLLDCEFATLAATTPLSFVTHAANAARHVKTLHAAVENDLLEKHVASVWSALRLVLQLDEYFAQSASLAHAMKVAASQPPQRSGESVAELVVAKAAQLLVSSRLEERFRGERWLAELLLFGLRREVSANDDNDSHESTPNQRLLAEEHPNSDQLEESLCYDEAAETRLVARAKLWELCRSPSVASRMVFARVLSLFTRHRVSIEAPPSVIISHIRDLNPCLDALATQGEKSAGVLVTILDTLLRMVIPSSEVPYLDVHRQHYDAKSSDVPQQPVGILVGSESLAAKVLRGSVCVNRSFVSELSLAFLLHALDVLDATAHPLPSLVADYGAVAALLVTYTLEDSHNQRASVDTLVPFLDAHDPRVAVIASRSIVTLIKRDHGDPRYSEIVRQIHAIAIESDDETPLVNSVAHARAVLRFVHLENGNAP